MPPALIDSAVSGTGGLTETGTVIDLLTVLDGKWDGGNRPGELYAAHVAKAPKQFAAVIIEGLGSKKKRVQGGCAELASLLSADSPELLYPHVDLFAANLRAKEPILRWEAACTLGNLASVDGRKVLPKQVPTLADLLSHESIVLQGHAVKALAKIAQVYPAEAPRIFDALSGSTQYFPGSRVGYLVEAMGVFGAPSSLAKKARTFVSEYVESEHAPVARKAKKALKQLGA